MVETRKAWYPIESFPTEQSEKQDTLISLLLSSSNISEKQPVLH